VKDSLIKGDKAMAAKKKGKTRSEIEELFLAVDFRIAMIEDGFSCIEDNFWL
jgi:hypothetical protein